jgi:tetratricopeptide (TPR) repeat protein
MQSNAQMQQGSKLDCMLGFLSQDPTNTTLLADAASVAFDAGDPDLSGQLIERYAGVAALPANLVNLQGLIALAQQRYQDAADILAGLRARGTDDPGLRFNLAWARAMTGSWQQALDLLDDQSIAVAPQGPSLKIQMLHHLEKLEDALACGEILAERYPDNEPLMAALANVAIDAEKPDLALVYAKRAGTEGQAALGILALGEQNVVASLPLFEEALRADPRNARALVGKGLSLLSSGDAAGGTAALDRGAELFRTHIGSWVAAGWAYFITRDYAAARERFERAMALDPNFAETHGGIAVLNVMDQRWDDAARESDIALRLDKNCFGAALAKSLLLEHRGHPKMAEKVLHIAMSTPVGPQGQTLVQMLAGFGTRPH